MLSHDEHKSILLTLMYLLFSMLTGAVGDVAEYKTAFANALY